MSESRILKPGQNCWLEASADRLAVLGDTATFFEAVASAFEQARHSISIIGWDIHSRVQLRRRDDDSRSLLELLSDCARRYPELTVRILIWEEDIIYSFEREMMQKMRIRKKTPDNIHFRYDKSSPVGTSQHQKLVTVDDCLGFVGGIDLAQRRWDVAPHEPGDDRRVTPNKLSFEPFHDAHTAFDGAAARKVAVLARWRWEHATGEHVDAVPVQLDHWPEGLEPDFQSVEIGLARTLPSWLVQPEVREVEALFFDSFAAASERIYLENQYLSSSALTDALARKLEEEDGPEIVIIVPEDAAGLIEQATLDALRAEMVERLREADKYDRLRVVCPEVGQGEDCQKVYVHAKICVIDDTLLRVGSANLTNRSLGVDSECDVVLEADNAETRRRIARVRNRLLGNHLGLAAEEVAEYGSLVEAVDAHQTGERRLVPLALDISPSVAEQWADEALLDPKSPLDAQKLAERLLPGSEESSRRSFAGLAGLLGLLVLAAVLWQWTPLGEWADPRHLAAVVQPIAELWWSVPLAICGFVLLSVIAFPTSVLILTMGFVFGGLWGSVYAFAGTMLSAALSYGLGERLGAEKVTNLAGERASRIHSWVAERGVWSVVTLRMVPVAPYGVVNLVIGGSRIPFRDFLWGTVIGMTPGIILKGIFGNELADFLAHPDPVELAVLLAIVAVFVAGGIGVSRLIRKHRSEGKTPSRHPADADAPGQQTPEAVELTGVRES